MKYVTRLERFEAGDFPMVCVRSGRTATKMVPVQASGTANWPWLFFPAPLLFLLARLIGEGDRRWGRLPFAEGAVEGVTAVYDKRVGVVLRGVHRDFVAATRRAQGV